MSIDSQRILASNTLAVGEHFRKVRMSAKLTMREAAQQASVLGFKCVHSTISKMEYGQRRIDVAEYLVLCRVYKVDPMQTLALLLPHIR